MYAKSDFTVDSMKRLLSPSLLKTQTSPFSPEAKVCRTSFYYSHQEVSYTVSGWVYELVVEKWWKAQSANGAKPNRFSQFAGVLPETAVATHLVS